MIGALVGIKNIPSNMIDALLSFDCLNNGRRRPEFLSVMRHGLPNIQNLIQRRSGPELVFADEGYVRDSKSKAN